MAAASNKPKKTGKTAKPASAADRIQTPPFKPTNGITIEQIDRAIRDVMAKRSVQNEG